MNLTGIVRSIGMIDEIIGTLVIIPFMIILWEIAVIFGKIFYDDYFKEDKYECHIGDEDEL